MPFWVAERPCDRLEREGGSPRGVFRSGEWRERHDPNRRARDDRLLLAFNDVRLLTKTATARRRAPPRRARPPCASLGFTQKMYLYLLNWIMDLFTHPVCGYARTRARSSKYGVDLVAFVAPAVSDKGRRDLAALGTGTLRLFVVVGVADARTRSRHSLFVSRRCGLRFLQATAFSSACCQSRSLPVNGVQ